MQTNDIQSESNSENQSLSNDDAAIFSKVSTLKFADEPTATASNTAISKPTSKTASTGTLKSNLLEVLATIEESNQELEQQKFENENLKKLLDQQQQQTETLREIQQKDLKRIQTQSRGLIQKNNKYRHELRDTQTALQSLESEKMNLEHSIEILNRQISDGLATQAELTGEIETLQTQLSSAYVQITTLQNELMTSQSGLMSGHDAINEYTLQIVTLEQKTHELTQTLAAQTAEKDQNLAFAQSEFSELLNEIQKNEDDLTQKQKDLHELQKTATVQLNQIDNQARLIDELSEKIRTQEKTLKNGADQLELALHEIHCKEEELKSHQTRVTALEIQLQSQVESQISFENEVQVLKRSLNEQGLEFAVQRLEAEKNVNEIKKLKNDLLNEQKKQIAFTSRLSKSIANARRYRTDLLRKKNRQLRKHIELIAQLQQNGSEQTQTLARLTAELQTAEEKYHSLRKNSAHHEGQIEHERRKLKDSHVEIERLNENQKKMQLHLQSTIDSFTSSIQQQALYNEQLKLKLQEVNEQNLTLLLESTEKTKRIQFLENAGALAAAQLTEQQLQHNKDLENLNQAHQENIRRTQTRSEAWLLKQNETNQARLTEKSAKHEHEIEALKSSFDATQAELRSGYEAEMLALTAQMHEGFQKREQDFNTLSQKHDSYIAFMDSERNLIRQELDEIQKSLQLAVHFNPIKEILNITQTELGKIERELRKLPASAPARPALEQRFDELDQQQTDLKRMLAATDLNLKQIAARKARVDERTFTLSVPIPD